MRQRTGSPAPPHPAADPRSGDGAGLHALLELETSLDARLDSAREEAARIRADAHSAAEAARLRADERARVEEEVLVTRMTGERTRALAELGAETERRVGRLQAISTGRVDAIARSLLEQVIDPASSAPGP